MKHISNWSIIILFILFFMSQFLPHKGMTYMYTVMTAIMIVSSIFYSKGISKYFGIVMTVTGTAILFISKQPADIWIEAITKNLPLVCLIVVVPILGIPISLGKYHEQLAGLTAKFQTKPQILYLIISGLFFLIAPITNIGSIYIVHSMLEKLRLPKELLGRVYVRGITSVHTWSPYFASVFLVVYSLQIPISKYVPYGLFLSIIQIIIAFILFTYIEMKSITFDLQQQTTGNGYKKLIELCIALFLITGFIFILEPFIPMNVSILIAIIVLFFAFVWGVYLREPKPFVHEINEYRKRIFPAKANEINLLLTAGFFGVVLAGTPVSMLVNKVWALFADVSIFVLILGTIIIVAILSFIGVHQIITISTIIATVSYDALGIHVIVMAMMLLSAWQVSTALSPVSPVITIVSSITKENPFKIIVQWNLVYAIMLALTHSFVIYLIHLFWL